MNIFFDHKIFTKQNYGGPSRYFVNLVEKLNLMNDINAKIFAPFHINFFLSKTNRDNKNNLILPFSNQLYKFNSVKKYLLKINNIINEKNLQNFNSDITHTTYYDSSFPKNSDNLVITVFDLIHEIFREDYGFKENYYPKKKILKKAKQIICISESTKNDLINYYDIDESKITVTYLASNFNISKEENIKKNRIIDDKYFLYVGSRWKYKNFEKLLYCLNYNPSILKNFKLILFGGGDLVNHELKLISKLNLNKDKIIQMDGNENILKSLYANAEFFIYTSKHEGFGIPILESFSLRCPVLCGNTSSLPEVAGDAALFFNPNDHISISNSIEKILNNNDLKQLYIKKGLERTKLFSWDKCAMETLNIYKKVNLTK
tara:strand:- start:31 stop:1155 length:1125 start_codon:yes stop_codon:yes gene_type:complete